MDGWAGVPVFGRVSAGVAATVRPSAYAIVEGGDGRIAVVRTPVGLFLPGGGMEPSESPAETAVREVREECGLAIRIGRWTARAVDHVPSDSGLMHYEKRATFVDAAIDGPPLGDGEPDHELLWMKPDEAAARLEHPSHRWAVGEWVARR